MWREGGNAVVLEFLIQLRDYSTPALEDEN
jgi:hypothetical protein